MKEKIVQLEDSGPIDPKMEDIQHNVNKMNNKKFKIVFISWLVVLIVIAVVIFITR